MESQDLINLRKELHSLPELSNKEIETARTIKEFVSVFAPDQIIENVGGNGLIFIFKGIEPGPNLLFRCDMDALPIHEINTFNYRSNKENISHKCGHDGHMAIVAGLAKSLNNQKHQKGQVILLFQPAEETGEGALKVLADQQFQKLEIDYVFAIHNLPGYKMHQVIVKEGIFNASVTTMLIKLYGKTAHAAEPEQGINPSFAFAEFIQEFNKYMVNDPKNEDFVVITPVFTNIGALAYGTSAGEGESHFTIRCWSQQQMIQLKKTLVKLSETIANKHNLKLTINWAEDFQSNQNDNEAIQFVRNAAKQNGFDILEKKEPFKWGEDFGIFTQSYKGVMFGLGAGERTPFLHNPDYDFPDEIIDTGIKMFRSIIDLILKYNHV